MKSTNLITVANQSLFIIVCAWPKKDMGVGFCIPQGGFNFGEEYGLVGSLILYEI